MKRLKSFLYLICFAIVLIIGCEDDSGIFNDSFKHLYGKWKLYSVSGGFGGGHEQNFDFLIVEKLDKYKIIKNDTIIDYGKIIIKEQDKEQLLIEFESTESSLPMYFPSAYVEFYSTDTLFLNSICCDWYDYHFVRK